jgi:carboxylesterase
VSAPVLPGAEPYSSTGGPDGALVLHGFTGNPHSMRALAELLAAEGLTVELPLLPGHGTAVADMVPTRWADWSRAAESAYCDLAERCSRVVVVGLSMGGALSCWLAERHVEVAGLVLVNPLVEPVPAELRDGLTAMLDAGSELLPGIGSDIAEEGVEEGAYAETPLAAAASLFDALPALAAGLTTISCPVLLFSSREDHVVAPSSGDLLQAEVTGPVERIWLEHSYHVATLDADRGEIEARTVTFVRHLLAGAA